MGGIKQQNLLLVLEGRNVNSKHWQFLQDLEVRFSYHLQKVVALSRRSLAVELISASSFMHDFLLLVRTLAFLDQGPS